MLLRKLVAALCPLLLCVITCAAFRWLDGWLGAGSFLAFAVKGLLLGAALALNMLINDDEWKAEVYSCASDRQQAAIVIDVAVDMVRQKPTLSKLIKIIPSTKRMVYQPTGSIYQVLSSEVATKHGFNF